jgi:hydroxymethylpyrimidine pyrophosphatase-like HAD family hydrolase
LYQLAYLTAGPQAVGLGSRFASRPCARAAQAYFASVYFDDLAVESDGPLCGIDIDGVLETEYLGFPALTPASARGLRALRAHGFRPVIVSGRSVGDVTERCAAYGLPGGVAEYGCATIDGADGSVRTLGTVDERAAMERLRQHLHRIDGVVIDADYTHAIRAFVRDSTGSRRPLPAELTTGACREAGAEEITAVNGLLQTDYIPASIDKGRGVRELVARLATPTIDAGEDLPLAFAVGDTEADLPMFALAARAFAPHHAERALRGRVTLTRRSYQAGFAEAVAQLIGHAPGSCEQCRVRRLTPESSVLLGLLGLRESGIRRVPVAALKLAARR